MLRQLLREWWAAAVPVVHVVLDSPLAGAAARDDGVCVVLSEKAVRDLVGAVSMEATVVDQLLPGEPFGAGRGAALPCSACMYCSVGRCGA